MFVMRYLLFVILACMVSVMAQEFEIPEYLPQGIKYKEGITSPEDFFGFPVGKWHLSHDKIVYYSRHLAENSDRVTYQEYAKSHEERPLVILTITSAENQGKIEEIRQQHLRLSSPKESSQLAVGEMPLVVYMGYGVHGDEASAMNASMLIAYYLAAGEGEQVTKLLQNNVILLDPCINPDGSHRFATWVNSHRSHKPVADSISREHREVWPTGRTNHYWFDLNRDWLLVQHPESQGRIEVFQNWRPNVLTDYHEMGTNSTYFFQPGIPTRTHPITPPRNYELTEKIAEFHARALDKHRVLYFTKERFDDFYYGKGSTYPDVHGAIGILFEQATAAGHLQESVNGLLSFPFAIHNHVHTSLSTFAAIEEYRVDLLEYQRDFYQSALSLAKEDNTKAYVVADDGDPYRLYHFVELLKRHKIKVYQLAKDVPGTTTNYEKANAYIVPLEQPQYRLIKAVFEQRTTFEEPLFYDVSTWTLPFAFNLPFQALKKKDFSQALLGQLATNSRPHPEVQLSEQLAYAYLLDWKAYYAPKALSRLLQAGLTVKVATKDFRCVTEQGEKDFPRGTLLLAVGIQEQQNLPQILPILNKIVQEDGVMVDSVATGLTPQGIDLGSGSFEKIHEPKILLVVGDGVRSYDAGEVWHLLDHRLHMPVVPVDIHDFDRAELSKYNTIVMVEGSYHVLGESAASRIKSWLENGGNLVLFKGAIDWAENNDLLEISKVTEEEIIAEEKPERKSYGDLDYNQGVEYIGGSIVEGQMDLTHPLCYGYSREKIAIFRRGTQFFEHASNSYATPIVYSSAPLLSGHISEENLAKLSDSAMALIYSLGSGRIVCLADNTNFRAFWYGTNKIFINALLFAPMVDSDATEKAE